LGEHASELYAKNQLNLLELMIHEQAVKLDWTDEIIAKAVLTHAGEIKNEAAKKAVESA
jgi:H+-translocating NAD(P) transhydrogenase subunit alpha